MATASRRSLFVLAALVLAVSGASQWWAGHREAQLGGEMASAARAGDILMVSSDTCVFCGQARAWLREHGVAFSECSIERDAACAARYRALMMPGTPVLLVRGQTQLGFDPERVLRALSAGVAAPLQRVSA